ncbi:MAG: hypothetical protein ACRERD_17425 [Candidatus Binatia bacterium]
MGDKEYHTEQIKYLIELLRLSWLTLVAVGGGTASLLLGEITGKRAILAGTGAVVTLILVIVGGFLNRRIRRHLTHLKELTP